MIHFCSKDVGRCIYFVFTYQEFISPVVRNSELESIFSETVLLDWSHSSISFYFWSFAVLFLYLKHLYRQPVTPRWALNLSGKTRICQNSQSSLQGELVEQKRSWGVLSKWSMTEYKTKKMWYFFFTSVGNWRVLIEKHSLFWEQFSHWSLCHCVVLCPIVCAGFLSAQTGCHAKSAEMHLGVFNWEALIEA